MGESHLAWRPGRPRARGAADTPPTVSSASPSSPRCRAGPGRDALPARCQPLHHRPQRQSRHPVRRLGQSVPRLRARLQLLLRPPLHEYLGLSAGLDFESRIFVKEDAPELLRRELMAPSWRPQTLAFSGVTDCYQPVERRLELTRRCLAVCAELRNPVAVITKSALVARDTDLLAELSSHGAALVSLSVTTLDVELARRLEPRAAAPRERLAALARLSAAGVPTSVMLAPMIPGLTDHEIPAIVEAAAAAGATTAGFLPLRLPGAVAGLFSAWLEEHYPDRRDKVLHRVREMRGGRLNDPRFGHRFRGDGPFAEQMRRLFETARRRHGLARRSPILSAAAFRRPGDQLGLFP